MSKSDPQVARVTRPAASGVKRSQPVAPKRDWQEGVGSPASWPNPAVEKLREEVSPEMRIASAHWSLLEAPVAMARVPLLVQVVPCTLTVSDQP